MKKTFAENGIWENPRKLFTGKTTPGCLVVKQFMAFSISKKFNYKLKV